jgi:hypothetical protein
VEERPFRAAFEGDAHSAGLSPTGPKGRLRVAAYRGHKLAALPWSSTQRIFERSTNPSQACESLWLRENKSRTLPIHFVRTMDSSSIARNMVINPRVAPAIVWLRCGRMLYLPYTNSMCTQ